MDSNSLFRLKIQYLSENQETGAVEKNKIEILAQSANYTDAEAVLHAIVEEYGMEKLAPCQYEIIRGKFNVGDITGSPAIQRDGDTLCGLVQHSFSVANDGLYVIDTIVFGDAGNNGKDTKATYYIPAHDVADAQEKGYRVLAQGGNASKDCLVTSAKLDKVEYIYLTPQTSESLFMESKIIFG